jgi:shikimate kinase
MAFKGKKIFLVGMMGVGKSTLGKKLARLSAYDHIDTDQEIERRVGKSINQIFEEEGEEEFRKHEAALYNALLADERDLIISTGGGFLTNLDSMDELLRYGICVYIKAEPKFISSRIYKPNSTRPLVNNSRSKEELEAHLSRLIEEREHQYAQAQVHVNAKDLDAQSLWESLKLILE